MKRATFFALLCCSALAWAQPQQQQREHRGPPQEAFDACKGKKDGDTAETKTPRGEIRKGICRLVMIPSKPDDGPRR
jgi:hypothetical protein